MDKYVVVAIDNSKARFFTLEPAEWPEYESDPSLVEQSSLSDSELKSGWDLWWKITHKDERESEISEPSDYKFKRKFAQKITSEIINLVRINQGQNLILVADTQILNVVRKCFIPTLFNNLKITELNRDISHLNVTEIHNYLAQKELMPAYQKVFYPR